MIMSLENVVTTCVLLVYIIPTILYQYTGNPREIIAIIGAFGTGLISEGMKHLIVGMRSPRPDGARDCDLICSNGPQINKPGMPSGHSTLATFFSAYYFNETNNIWIKLALIIFGLSIMYSRYTKRCHTAEQAIAGGIFGTTMGLLARKYM